MLGVRTPSLRLMQGPYMMPGPVHAPSRCRMWHRESGSRGGSRLSRQEPKRVAPGIRRQPGVATRDEIVMLRLPLRRTADAAAPASITPGADDAEHESDHLRCLVVLCLLIGPCSVRFGEQRSKPRPTVSLANSPAEPLDLGSQDRCAGFSSEPLFGSALTSRSHAAGEAPRLTGSQSCGDPLAPRNQGCLPSRGA